MLPADLLLHIFQWLDPADLPSARSLRGSCKVWRSLICDAPGEVQAELWGPSDTASLAAFLSSHKRLTSLKVSSAHGGYSGTNEKPGLSQDPLIQQPPSSKFSQGAQQGGQEVAQAAEGAGGAVTLGAAVGRMLECLPPSLATLALENAAAVPAALSQAVRRLPAGTLTSLSFTKLPNKWDYNDGMFPEVPPPYSSPGATGSSSAGTGPEGGVPVATAVKELQAVLRKAGKFKGGSSLHAKVYGKPVMQRHKKYWEEFEGALAALLLVHGRHLTELRLETPARSLCPNILGGLLFALQSGGQALTPGAPRLPRPPPTPTIAQLGCALQSLHLIGFGGKVANNKDYGEDEMGLDISALKQLRGLTALALRQCGVSTSEPECLEALTNLKDLDLSGTSMIWHMRHAPQLSGLTALTRLVLRKCMWLGDCADPWLTDWWDDQDDIIDSCSSLALDDMGDDMEVPGGYDPYDDDAEGIRTTGRWYLRQPYFIAKPDHGLGPDHVLTLPPGIEELDLTEFCGPEHVDCRGVTSLKQLALCDFRGQSHRHWRSLFTSPDVLSSALQRLDVHWQLVEALIALGLGKNRPGGQQHDRNDDNDDAEEGEEDDYEMCERVKSPDTSPVTVGVLSSWLRWTNTVDGRQRPVKAAIYPPWMGTLQSLHIKGLVPQGLLASVKPFSGLTSLSFAGPMMKEKSEFGQGPFSDDDDDEDIGYRVEEPPPELVGLKELELKVQSSALTNASLRSLTNLTRLVVDDVDYISPDTLHLPSSLLHLELISNFDNDGGVEVLGPAMCKLLASLPRLTNLHLAWDLLSWEGTSVQLTSVSSVRLSGSSSSVPLSAVTAQLEKWFPNWQTALIGQGSGLAKVVRVPSAEWGPGASVCLPGGGAAMVQGAAAC